MIRVRYHPPGTAPATLAPPEEGSRTTKVSLIRYNESTIEELEVTDLDALGGLMKPGMVHWINVDGLGDVPLIERLGQKFGIHPLALEDILNTTQRAKAELFGDHIFVVADMVYAEGPGCVVAEQLSLFLGRDYVLTFQEEADRDVFEKVRARLRAGRGFARRRGSDYLAYVLLDATVDTLFPLVENVGDSIEEIEDLLLDHPSRETIRRLYECRRLLLLIRRSAWPMREVFNSLLRDDADFVTPGTKVFLRDCYDHCTQIIDILESYRDLAAGLMDLYLSSLGFRTNDIMRVLTVVSVLFIPLTFFAGVYGMNFETKYPLNMPELNWPLGYIFFWSLCVLVAGGMLVFFRRRKWI